MRYLFRKTIKHNRGFTLIEIVVVLLIAGIAFSIVGVSVGRIYEKIVFKEELKKLYRTLKHARDMAVIERAVFTINVDTDQRSVTLQRDGKPFGTTLTLPENVSIKGEPIVFFPKGNSSGGLIEIKGPANKNYLIEVSSVTGIAKVKRL